MPPRRAAPLIALLALWAAAGCGRSDLGERAYEPVPACDEVSACRGAGAPYVDDGGACAFSVCSDVGCERRPIEVRCDANELRVGCDCAPRTACEDARECAPLACIGGECAPCRADSDCAPGAQCAPSGACLDPGCVTDLDCPSDRRCDGGACVERAECLFDEDCGGAEEACLGGRCIASPSCEGGCPEGYECVGDRCFLARCRGPDDCAEGEVCDEGSCAVPASEVSSCAVVTPSTIVTPGFTTRLEAIALDQAGRAVAVLPTWSSSEPGVVSITGERATALERAGAARVTARIGSLLCEGATTFENAGPLGAGAVRVTVVDAASMAPVAGARVVVDGLEERTDSSGAARFMATPGPRTVSAFAEDYDYVSVLGLTSREIRLTVSPRSGVGSRAGFTGVFDVGALTTSGELVLGLAGAGQRRGLLNFSLEGLLGAPFRTSIAVPGVGGADLPLPGGLALYGSVLGLPLDIKARYAALATPGGQSLWGLAGRLPPERLLGPLGGVDSLGGALKLLLPIFSRFEHGSAPAILSARPLVVDRTDVDGDNDFRERVPDYDAFPAVDLRPRVRQDLVVSLRVSNVPQIAGRAAEVGVLVGGAELDATGFVPLGVSATGDDDGDGLFEDRLLSMAPPYGSLTGGRYAVIAIAFVSDSLNLGTGGLELPDDYSAVVWSGDTLPTALSLGTYPDTPRAIMTRDGARAIVVEADAGPLFRARFEGRSRSWEIWTEGAGGVAGVFRGEVVIPLVPRGVDDLWAAPRRVFLDAIRTRTSLDALVGAGGLGLRRAALVSTGFSRARVR